MEPACLPSIRGSLSSARLSSYRAAPTETESELLARYVWNLTLGATLQPALHLVEIALRNAFHEALTNFHGGNRSWYQLPNAFHPSSSESLKKVQRAVQKLPQPTTPNAPDRVVAQLDFGFWTTFLSRPYGSPASRRRQWQPLWPRLIPNVFPGYVSRAGASNDREALATRFDNIRNLRNRISHHEPIWRGLPRPGTPAHKSLPDQYAEIIEALAWLNPDLTHLATALSSFHAVYQHGPAGFQGLIDQLP